jgi:hypothetical protein
MRTVVVLAVLFSASLALAAPDAGPKRDLRPADQARARTMVLKRSDLAPGYRELPGSGEWRACPGLDLSSVTLTGMASSPAWLEGETLVFGSSFVYGSAGDAERSLAIQLGRKGLSCSRAQTRRAYGGPGVSIEEGKLALPRLAAHTFAYRLVVRKGAAITFAIESVVLRQGRGHSSVSLGTNGALPPRSELLRLSRALAKRLRLAMRGA